MRIESFDFRAESSPHPDAPRETPYRFPKCLTRDLSIAVRLGLNVLLTGPTGCGKTSLPVALAARLGIPLIRFNLNGETRVSGLVGQQKPVSENGVLTLKFSHGALVRALREGYWIILDEIDAAPPSVLMVLQPVLEEGNKSIHIPETDETIRAHERCMIFGTGNTLGIRAQQRAHHAGTHMMNSAFIDRFGMVLQVDYPELEEEIERVKVHLPEVPHPVIQAICFTASELRKDPSFKSDFSTRRCIQWGRIIMEMERHLPEGFESAAFQIAIGNKLENPSDRKVATEWVQRVFG